MITLLVCSRSAKIPTDLPASPSAPAPPTEPPSRLIARLYAEERSFVRNLVLRRGVPARDADDVVHEVFLVVCRRIADLDPTHTARPWLYVIAIQVASNYRKRARHSRERLPGVLPDEPAQVLAVDERIAHDQERARFRARLLRLRPKLRAVVVPHIIEERSISDIAVELGIPEKTAYARMHLARSALTRHAQRKSKT
ncbi:RNA polymerase sigma factor [Polyangium aurulentum]|uniref:RNA polymerase sigma factor n=1 Tax=Polyangium aurulentum TaxID=2567896 RepID=UPI001139AF28|nr:sigma-70 family RNA polymerase sigma factor [Polyangium aurulentum]